MNNEKFLPIGSVVILKEAKRKLMITGFAIKSSETGDKMYDYLGCLYPIGVVSSDNNFVFDHDQIQEVFYRGYDTDEWKATETRLKDAIARMTGAPISVNTTEGNLMQSAPAMPSLTTANSIPESINTVTNQPTQMAQSPMMDNVGTNSIVNQIPQQVQEKPMGTMNTTTMNSDNLLRQQIFSNFE